MVGLAWLMGDFGAGMVEGRCWGIVWLMGDVGGLHG